MRFFTVKKQCLLSLALFTFFSNQVLAIQCFQYYRNYANAKWKEESDPYRIGIQLANDPDRRLQDYEKIYFKPSKHQVPPNVIIARDVSAAYNQAFAGVKYFGSTSVFLEMMTFALTTLKLNTVEANTFSRDDIRGLIKENLNSVVLPLLLNEKGDLDNETRLYLLNLLERPTLTSSFSNSKSNNLSFYFRNRAIDNVNGIHNFGLTVLHTFSSFWGTAPPRARFSNTPYHHDLDGFKRAFELLGVKTKELNTLKDGKQFTLFLESSGNTFDSISTRNPVFILKVDGDVVVFAEHSDSGKSWHFRVMKKSEIFGFNDHKVRSKKLISFEFNP